MSKPDPSTAATPAPVVPRKAPRRFGKLRLAILSLLLALVSLSEPRIFRFTAQHLIRFEAWRCGISVQIGSIESTVFDPLCLVDTLWDYQSPAGVSTHLEVARAEAHFDWKGLLQGDTERWFEQLYLLGVNGRINLPSTASSAHAAPAPAPQKTSRWTQLGLPRGRWTPTPLRVQVRDVNLLIENPSADSVRFEQVRFLASELEPGFIRIGRLTLAQPWLKRSFHDVRGSTALQDSRLIIAGLNLEPGVVLRSFSAQMAGLAKGRLDAKFLLEAFGGTIDGQAQLLPDSHPLSFYTSSQFTQIDLAQFANFSGISDAAGGTITNGNFTFQGAFRELDKALASLWFEATNFQWESRQWDSLAMGASLMDRRLQISKLDLLQGQNRLSLSGQMALPLAGVKWWQSEFTCNVAATLENLTELSALILPEFQFAAGKANIDGSIQGRNQQFSGQLIVSGSHLTWHDAPIENLHAALKLEGNQCKISSAELFNKGDYVRGQGTVSLLGPLAYSGELRASIEELGTYAALLQKPLLPEAPAGGAVLEWSGEGSAKGHSGKFFARLNKLRSVGALASQLHPINANLDGQYSQGRIEFSQFALSDEASALTANVGIGNKALSLQHVRLTHGNQVALEGDALLPLDVWQAWPNTSLSTLLNADTVSQVHLTASQLDLQRASQLAGWKFPIAGILDGTLTASGPVSALKTGGKLTLSQGRLPLDWNGDTLEKVNATATLDGTKITVENLAAQHRFGSGTLSGTIDLQNIYDPVLALKLESSDATIPGFTSAPNAKAPVEIQTALSLQIDGPMSTATVTGSAQIQRIEMRDDVDLTPLWASDSMALPALFTFSGAPWKSWKFDLKGHTQADLPPEPAPDSVQVHLSGSGSEPVLEGRVQLTRANARPGISRLSAALTFHPERPRDPSIEVEAGGTLWDQPFTAAVLGPLSHPMRTYELWAPLDAELVRAFLSGQLPAPAAAVALTVPDVFVQSPALYEWKAIATPPEPAPEVPAAPATPESTPPSAVQ